MKQRTISYKLLLTLVLLIIAVLCVTNVTYSYFTSTSNTNGQVSFSDLNVRFVYREKEDSSLMPSDSSTIQLYSASGPIQREVPFQFALTSGGTAIEYLRIQNMLGSCECYVRFWIDAYVVKNGVVNTSVNYGKYFFLANETHYTRTNSSVENSWCYFFTESMTASATSSRTLGNTLVLKDISATDTVPVTLLGETLKISISLEAVQKANQAYLSVFGDADDTRGYLTSWT